MNNSNNAYSIKIGDKLALTFLSIKEFKFLRQTVRLHTANLMVNAFVKDIQENSDGSVKIMYCGTDSKPMYIAFSAFKNEEEAKQELNRILQHDKIYIDALTSDKYIRQFYSDI